MNISRHVYCIVFILLNASTSFGQSSLKTNDIGDLSNTASGIATSASSSEYISWANVPSNSIQATNGLQIVGTTLNTSSANLTLNNIPIGTSSFKLGVDIPNGLTQWTSYCNQAQISNLTASLSNLPNTIPSDNPKTTVVGDATCGLVKIYENCCNGIDDDGDGLCDDADSDCN